MVGLEKDWANGSNAILLDEPKKVRSRITNTEIKSNLNDK
jgi:hypothetical protein